MDSMAVTQAEYEGEVKARKDAESEVSTLRALLSGRATHTHKQEFGQQSITDHAMSEVNLSQPRVGRFKTPAGIEQFSASIKYVILEIETSRVLTIL